ncbi:hypothetical protein PCANB_001454 [Pneumocystis canis]|nr:hypothetical protein PCANB_001454 [Pneumocystis canis]
MSYFLPHLRTGWHVDQAILSEEERLVVIRFGRDGDEECMRQDEVLYKIAEKVVNFAVRTGNNNKINWALEDKQELIDIFETVYKGARKGRGLVISPKEFFNALETWIHEERKVITYRFLSRNMNIHIENAKQILLDYYKKCQENNKKCYAIYMISGYITKSVENNESLSAEKSLMMRIKVYYLVKERNINEIKQKLDEITLIYIYALESDPQTDISVLSDASLELCCHIKYDEILSLEETCKKYGIIYHPNVKMFPSNFQLSSTKTLPSKSIDISSKTNSSQPIMTSLNVNNKDGKLAPLDSLNKAEHGSKNVFVYYTELKTSTHTSECVSPGIRNETNISSINKNIVISSSKSEDASTEYNMVKRQQEIDELRKIMIDQEKNDITIHTNSVLKDDDISDVIKDEHMNSTKKKRGRRKVLKKVTSRDKKGYLVTKNEFFWESFSEDEISIPTKSKSDIVESKEAIGKTKAKLNETKITLFFSKKQSI